MVKVYILLDLDWTWVNSRILNESKKDFRKFSVSWKSWSWVWDPNFGFHNYRTFLKVWLTKARIVHETILGISNRKPSGHSSLKIKMSYDFWSNGRLEILSLYQSAL